MVSLEPADNTDLSLEELIRSHLRGKSSALEKYDAIIWKIRSGYIVILYGTLTVLGGEKIKLHGLTDSDLVLPFLLLLTWGMSSCAFLIDRSFIISKLRVINDWNQLSNLSLDLATGKKDRNDVELEIRDKMLLNLSGESLKDVDPIAKKRYLTRSLLLYLMTPIAATAIYSVIRLIH